MTRTNAGGPGAKSPGLGLAGEMAAFDALPPALRRRLNYATIPFLPSNAAVDVIRLRCLGYSESDSVDLIVGAITRTEDQNAVGPLPKRRGEP